MNEDMIELKPMPQIKSQVSVQFDYIMDQVERLKEISFSLQNKLGPVVRDSVNKEDEDPVPMSELVPLADALRLCGDSLRDIAYQQTDLLQRIEL